LEKLVAQQSIKGLNDADLHYLTMGWHRLHPWPDSVAGLTRLKKKYIISPLSNGNVALLTNMAKFAGLPWDLVMSAELFEHYKPDPETYLGAAKLLCLPPEQVMMVAAHNHDLKAAQKLGLKNRLRRSSDRIRAAAEIRFRSQGRLGHRGKGFWRHRRPDGVLRGQALVFPTRCMAVLTLRVEMESMPNAGCLAAAACHAAPGGRSSDAPCERKAVRPVGPLESESKE